jgi:hypothetical protein
MKTQIHLGPLSTFTETAELTISFQSTDVLGREGGGVRLYWVLEEPQSPEGFL